MTPVLVSLASGVFVPLFVQLLNSVQVLCVILPSLVLVIYVVNLVTFHKWRYLRSLHVLDATINHSV